ncbi:MAG: GIY-YIG nuclease family protein [Clostridiales bacterium]|nr:GIY-YIG nuclease family protein [Clostridiales bacterium]
MDNKERRKALLAQYKEMKTYMGAIQVKNNRNGKIFVAAYPNLKNKWLTLSAQLDAGRFANAALQADWKEYGRDAFTCEVLEEKPADTADDVKWAVKQLQKAWINKLQPFGENGYNKTPE